MIWLASGPGARCPRTCAAAGRWVICGYGGSATELSADLRAEGLEVTVVEVAGGTVLEGDGRQRGRGESRPWRKRSRSWRPPTNDTTNLSLVAAARRVNPGPFVAARQNRTANAPLFTPSASTSRWCPPR